MIMNNISGMRIKNIRCFGSENPIIPINTINLLVGKNSSGKSTFSRLFPLLRQSLESNTRGPLLWFGNYVDFGDFNTSFNSLSDSGQREIVFEFEMSLRIDNCPTDDYLSTERRVRSLVSDGSSVFPLTVSLGVVDAEKRTVASRVVFDFGYGVVEVFYKQGRVCQLRVWSNEFDFYEEFEAEYRFYGGSFIPLLQQSVKIATKKSFRRFAITSELDGVSKPFADFVKKYHHKKKSYKAIVDVISGLEVSSESEVFESISKSFKNDRQFWKNISGEEGYFSRVSFFYLVCKQINKFITVANEVIEDTFLGVRYLGPIRATAERFYRYQDLQVNEIDHVGANLPMLINSLAGFDKIQLRQWMQEHFGFWFVEESHGSHYALLIQEEGDETPHNISDMGFGYSQILPVLISIWLESDLADDPVQSLSSIESSIIVIEQPELHLHPVLQYKFASAVASIAKKSHGRVRFVFETHSSHIIEGLGDSVREGGISNEEINIVLFEKDPGENSRVSFTEFDSEGYLDNWPAGFLSA